MGDRPSWENLCCDWITRKAVIVDVICISGDEDQREWKVTLTHKSICAVTGSSVVMPCSFTHPPGLTVTKVYWLIDPKEGKGTSDLNSKASYKGRVQYFWNNDNNCTLKLNKVKKTDKATYHARIETYQRKNKWQSKSAVHLTVLGKSSKHPVKATWSNSLIALTTTICMALQYFVETIYIFSYNFYHSIPPRPHSQDSCTSDWGTWGDTELYDHLQLWTKSCSDMEEESTRVTWWTNNQQ